MEDSGQFAYPGINLKSFIEAMQSINDCFIEFLTKYHDLGCLMQIIFIVVDKFTAKCGATCVVRRL